MQVGHTPGATYKKPLPRVSVDGESGRLGKPRVGRSGRGEKTFLRKGFIHFFLPPATWLPTGRFQPLMGTLPTVGLCQCSSSSRPGKRRHPGAVGNAGAEDWEVEDGHLISQWECRN